MSSLGSDDFWFIQYYTRKNPDIVRYGNDEFETKEEAEHLCAVLNSLDDGIVYSVQYCGYRSDSDSEYNVETIEMFEFFKRMLEGNYDLLCLVLDWCKLDTENQIKNPFGYDFDGDNKYSIEWAVGCGAVCGAGITVVFERLDGIFRLNGDDESFIESYDLFEGRDSVNMEGDHKDVEYVDVIDFLWEFGPYDRTKSRMSGELCINERPLWEKDLSPVEEIFRGCFAIRCEE